MNAGILVFGLVYAVAMVLSAQDRSPDSSIVPLPRAHAHNDYEHQRPLMDALENGFCSVEADIFLVDGKLLVAHDKWQLRQERTLEKLYLAPLKQRVDANEGRVHKGGPQFTLLVDIKENGAAVYPVLKSLLVKYESMLSGMRNGKYDCKAVQIVVSGNCPRNLIAEDPTRLVSIDGRLPDLDSKLPDHLIPMISARWGSTFRWRGKSEITDQQQARLQEIVAKAHKHNRRVRFWASPESEVVWRKLVAVGVDHINTDQLERLRNFLLSTKDKIESNVHSK